MKKQTSPKAPIALRTIQIIFPILEAFTPKLAQKWSWNLFFRPIKFKTPIRELAILNNANIENISISGKKVFIYSWGKSAGPMVLLVHGWSGRASQFYSLIPELVSSGHYVVALDGPAHGRSEGSETHVLEFAEAISKIENKYGKISAGVGHSFGGISLLNALKRGTNIPKIITIATPTTGQDIIDGFLKKINGSSKIDAYLKRKVLDQFGFSFDSLSACNIIKSHQPEALIMIHDEDDNEVTISNPETLQKLFPSSKLIKTKGLGHTRILRDKGVIKLVTKNCNHFTIDNY